VCMCMWVLRRDVYVLVEMCMWRCGDEMRCMGYEFMKAFDVVFLTVRMLCLGIKMRLISEGWE